MRRASRLLIGLILLQVVASGFAATGETATDVLTPIAAAERARRPNVVLILTDDMRADELRYLPNVRRLLVDKGVRFTQAISPHPMCCPARAELFAGQYGQNSGVRHNTGPWGGDRRLTRPNANLGRWLRTAGYNTSFHGKFLNAYERHPWRPAGWTRWDAQIGGIYSYWHGRFVGGDVYQDRYVSRVMTERSGAAIRQFHRVAAPFFTWINQVAPHGTAAAPMIPLYQAKYARAYAALHPKSLSDPAFDEADIRDLPPAFQRPRVSRDRMIRLSRARLRALRSVDDAVAATVGLLRRLGELDNTYIVFTSDNGHGLGEHRLDGKNLLFDVALHVPLVIRGPRVAEGRSVGDLVSLVDLPPTILALTGAMPNRRLDGRSLVPLLDGVGALRRDTVLVQTGDTVRDNTPGWAFRGVDTHRYLFGRKAGDGRIGVLFDRRRDPHQLVNRYHDPSYRDVRAQLNARTNVLVRCSGIASCNRSFGPLPAPAVRP
jgi:arylsulfatase A-like enzyme